MVADQSHGLMSPFSGFSATRLTTYLTCLNPHPSQSHDGIWVWLKIRELGLPNRGFSSLVPFTKMPSFG